MIGLRSTDRRLTRLVDSKFGLDLSGDKRLNMARSFEGYSKGLNAPSRGSQADCPNRTGHISAAGTIILEATAADMGDPECVHDSIVGVTMCFRTAQGRIGESTTM